MDITSISNNVLGEASQAVDCGVYFTQNIITYRRYICTNVFNSI